MVAESKEQRPWRHKKAISKSHLTKEAIISFAMLTGGDKAY